MIQRLKRLVPWRLRVLGGRVEETVTDGALSLVTRRIPLPASVDAKQIYFIGASVGRDWRLHLVFPNIQTLTAYQYDKGELVEQVLMSRPDAVIIKECAAYFPPDRADLEQIRRWVEKLWSGGVRAALATVVPVTREHARRLPGRVEGLWRFNDLLRQYALQAEVPLLDLEAALRISPEDRHLDPALHSGDGLHLSRRAYRRRMDPLIPPLLLRLFSHG